MKRVLGYASLGCLVGIMPGLVYLVLLSRKRNDSNDVLHVLIACIATMLFAIMGAHRAIYRARFKSRSVERVRKRHKNTGTSTPWIETIRPWGPDTPNRTKILTAVGAILLVPVIYSLLLIGVEAIDRRANPDPDAPSATP